MAVDGGLFVVWKEEDCHAFRMWAGTCDKTSKKVRGFDLAAYL